MLDFQGIPFEKIKKKKKIKKTHAKLYTQAQLDKEIDKAVALCQKSVWQYLYDHTTLNGKGLSVVFSVKSEDNFWKRVHARKERTFVRNAQVKPEELRYQIFKFQRDHVVYLRLKSRKFNENPLVYIIFRLWKWIQRRERRAVKKEEIYQQFSLFYAEESGR